MKLPILAVFFCVTCMVGVAATPKPGDWVTPSAKIPHEIVDNDNRLAEDQFYECRVTAMGTAIDRLEKVSFIELTDELATYYAGHSYHARKNHKAYLVRGAFANYTGKFLLFYHDGTLLIQHMSLGRKAIPQFCPLIVQLPAAPRKVYIQIGGAI